MPDLEVQPLSPLVTHVCPDTRLLAFLALVNKRDIIEVDRAFQAGDTMAYERIVEAASPSPPTEEEVNACARAFQEASTGHQ